VPYILPQWDFSSRLKSSFLSLQCKHFPFTESPLLFNSNLETIMMQKKCKWPAARKTKSCAKKAVGICGIRFSRQTNKQINEKLNKIGFEQVSKLRFNVWFPISLNKIDEIVMTVLKKFNKENTLSILSRKTLKSNHCDKKEKIGGPGGRGYSGFLEQFILKNKWTEKIFSNN